MTLHEIMAFTRKTGMAETAFGRKVANDPRLIGDMRDYGRAPRPKMADRIRAFMEGYSE